MKYSIDVKKFIYIKYFQNKFIHEFINKVFGRSRHDGRWLWNSLILWLMDIKKHFSNHQSIDHVYLTLNGRGGEFAVRLHVT
jgi:hypothetical protein